LDTRYIIIGISVVSLGAVLGLYAYLAGLTSLLGISTSIILVGAVITVLGYSYGEPTTNLLIDYFKNLSPFITSILEDLRLSNILPSSRISGESIYIILSRRNPVDFDELNPGVNVVGGEAIYVIPIPNEYTLPISSELYDIEARLRDTLVGEYGLCTDVDLGRSGELIRLRVIGIDRRLLDIPLTPLNPLDLTILSILTKLLGKGLYFERRVIEGSEYIAEFRVLG